MPPPSGWRRGSRSPHQPSPPPPEASGPLRDRPQGGDVVVVSLAPRVCERQPRPGAFALEALLDRHVARLLEHRDVFREERVAHLDEVPQMPEVEGLGCGQRGHHRQPHRGVDDLVQTVTRVLLAHRTRIRHAPTSGGTAVARAPTTNHGGAPDVSKAASRTTIVSTTATYAQVTGPSIRVARRSSTSPRASLRTAATASAPVTTMKAIATQNRAGLSNQSVEVPRKSGVATAMTSHTQPVQRTRRPTVRAIRVASAIALAGSSAFSLPSSLPLPSRFPSFINLKCIQVHDHCASGLWNDDGNFPGIRLTPPLHGNYSRPESPLRLRGGKSTEEGP